MPALSACRAARTRFARWLALALLPGLWLLCAGMAQAAAYVFPGNLPGGCSSSTSTQFNCGSLTLGAADTLSFANPQSTLTVSGTLNTGGARINAGGSAGDLTLNVSGTLYTAANAVINANVVAGAVFDLAGSASYGGSVRTVANGSVTLGSGSSVAGSITTVGFGAVTLGAGTSVAGDISSASGSIYVSSSVWQPSQVGGALTSTSGFIYLLSYASVGGGISCSCYVYVYDHASVGGSIDAVLMDSTAGWYNRFDGDIKTTTGFAALGPYTTVAGSVRTRSGAVYLYSSVSVAGSVECACSLFGFGGNQVDGSVSVDAFYDGGSSTYNGSVLATGYASLSTSSRIAGDFGSNTSSLVVSMNASVGQCVRARKSFLSLYMGASAGGVCCGAGSCGSSCLMNLSGRATPPLCASSVPTATAEYRFDEFSWNGSAGEVRDSSGLDHHGRRLNAAASHPQGKVCRAADIPADSSSTSQAIDSTVDLGSAVGQSGTISFWYRANGAWAGLADGQLFDATRTANRGFHLVRRAGGALQFVATDAWNTTLSVSTAAQHFGAGQWVHIAAAWDLQLGFNAAGMTVYVNGVATSTAATILGGLDSTLDTLYIGDSRANVTTQNATVNSANGRIDELRIHRAALTSSEVASVMAATHPCPDYGPDHLQIEHDGTALSCSPKTVTVKACADAACASLYSGGALSGTLNWSGAASGSVAFSIAAGQSQATVSVAPTSAGTVSLSTSGVSPSSVGSSSCLNTATNAASCALTVADSGLLFDVADHAADSLRSFSVAAVRKADNASLCVPAFASVTKNIQFRCSYANPASGTLPARVGGAALNAANSHASACDAGGRSVALAFNASGVASTTLQYADVGRLALDASYSGSGADAGLAMSGSDSFVAAPASFAFSAITSAPIKAGSAFAATLSARNASGAATPNFGRETPVESVSLSFSKAQPTGSGAVAGSFSGSLGGFSNGSASASNLVWTEVGSGDLSAALASGSYLGSGLTASGSTGSAGAVGRFVPHHFDLAATPACGSFSHAGQPFALTVSARNAAGGTTLNYDGSTATSPTHAKAVTLSDASALGVGTLDGAGVAAGSFSAGVASATPSYGYSAKLTGPRSLVLRATDSDGVSSAGFAEPAMPLRSSRLRLVNGFGSEAQALALAVRVDYWSGNAWVPNTADSCTTLSATAVARSNQRDATGRATGAWSSTPSAITLSNGQGVLSLSAPGAGKTGTLDLALNLGSTGVDQSCLANHPASTGANLPWLRAQQGGCTTSADRDPSARASFGIYSPETRKTVHIRELY